MKNYFFFIILIYLPAKAEWKKVYEEKDYVEYVDIDTIVSKNGISNLWILKNYNVKQTLFNKDYFTFKTNWLYDCEEEIHQLINAALFEKQMGKGKKVLSKTFSENERQWFINPPQHIFKIACKNE
tara:strand:+ start:39 stop:416 length:378 start_codon:yes stop_codon:yes gene_type:complete